MREKPVPLDREAGLILGTLFDRQVVAVETSPRRSCIGARQTEDILRTQGRSLTESDWGSYLLFLRRLPEQTVSIFRGPAGTLSCYYRTLRGCTLLVSCPGDFLWLRCGSFSINWDSIRAQAAAGDYLTRETGLSEVTTLISGDCLDIREGQVSIRSYWRPYPLRFHPVRGFSEAVDLLRSETDRCIRAWASVHEAVLLLLSGGLDSSIVLAYLRASSGPRVVAVNFHSKGAGDERPYARSMAEKTGTQLAEVASDPDIDLRHGLRCALTPNPVLNFSAFDVEPVVQQLARRWNATARKLPRLGHS